MLTLTKNREYSRMNDERAKLINHFAYTGNSFSIEYKNLSILDCFREVLKFYDFFANEYKNDKIELDMFISSIDTVRYHLHGDFDVAMNDYIMNTAPQYYNDCAMMHCGDMILIDTDDEHVNGFIENDIIDFFDSIEFGMFCAHDDMLSGDYTATECAKLMLKNIDIMHTVLKLYENA